MQKLPNDIVIIVLGASIFLLLLTLFIVFVLMAYKRRDFKHMEEKRTLEGSFNNQLLCSQIEVQEQTFQHIGKELHDNLGQLLSTSRMLIGLAERSLKSPPDTLLTANATLGKAIQELRSLSKSLDKEWLARFNLVDNIKAEVSRINFTNHLNVTLEIEHEPDFPASTQVLLFRVMQEAIQNAVKHSCCTNLKISLLKKEADIEITISDNGKGFAPQTQNKGMGLNNMEHRIGLLKGEINYDSPGNGTNIIIRVPETTNVI